MINNYRIKTGAILLFFAGGIFILGYMTGAICEKPSETSAKEPVALEEKINQNAEDILGLKEHIVDLYHVECKKLRRELELEELK